MRGDPWVHVGRLWTNGEPFLAVDAVLRDAWHGFSNNDYDQVVTLGQEDTSVPVGTRRGFLVGADGVVRDDSWMEVSRQSQASWRFCRPQALTTGTSWPECWATRLMTTKTAT
jgi:hypothetical protein